MKYAIGLMVAASLAVAGCGTPAGSGKGTCAGKGTCGATCSGTCATGTCVGKCKGGAAPAAGAATVSAAAGAAVAGVSRGVVPAVYVDQAPPIDGTLASPIWQKSPALVLGKVASAEIGPLQTTAHILLDKQNLYIGWECAEKNTAALVADATDRDGSVWSDDCIEVFISPDGDKAYHFVVNSKGVFQDGKGDVNEADDTTWNSKAVVKTAVVAGKCWTGTMSIPLKDLAPKSGNGQKWMLNINRTKPVKDGDSVTFTESSWSATGQSKYGDATGWGKLTGVNVP